MGLSESKAPYSSKFKDKSHQRGPSLKKKLLLVFFFEFFSIYSISLPHTFE